MRMPRVGFTMRSMMIAVALAAIATAAESWRQGRDRSRQLAIMYRLPLCPGPLTAQESRERARRNAELARRTEDASLLPWERPAWYRKHEAILQRLAEPLDLKCEAVSLDDLIKRVKALTVSADLPNGMPVYVDPEGLQDAEELLASPVGDIPQEVALGHSLRRILLRMGLKFEVAEDRLVISARQGDACKSDGAGP